MRIFGDTHIGLVREINEDCIFFTEHPIGPLTNLFIVADGMGGHNAGEIASSLAIEAFKSYIETASSVTNVKKLLEDAMQYANKVVYEKALTTLDMFGMGTTMVACTIYENTIYVANVGDSRLYVLQDTIEQVTVDHSYVEELVRAGEITRDESIHHPAKNKITRALGASGDVGVDVFELSTMDVRVVLLCSDGLSNMISDKEIESMLMKDVSLEQQGYALVQMALQNGGIDNISLIMVELTNRNEVSV